MGKVLKPLAIVAAVAVNVIPGAGQAISAGILSTIGATVTATALVSSITMVGLSAGLSMIAKKPKMSPAQSCPPVDVPTAFSLSGRGSSLNQPTTMSPKRHRRHRRRFDITRATGTCMAPHVEDGAIMLIDREAELRPGDLACFKVKQEHGGAQMGKRYVGTRNGLLEFETSNPRELWAMPLDSLDWVYRVRRYLPEPRGRLGLFLAYRRATGEIQRDNGMHQDRLGQIVPRGVE